MLNPGNKRLSGTVEPRSRGGSRRRETQAYLVEELDLVRWSMGKRFGFLGWQLQASADRPGGGEVGDEGRVFSSQHHRTAQQGVDLIGRAGSHSTTR